MTLGEHIFLVCAPMRSRTFGTFSWQAFDSDDEVVREAYKSVILLTTADETRFTNKHMDTWKRLWRAGYNRAKIPPQFELALPTLLPTHAAMEILGQIINETVHPGDTFPTGTELAKVMQNRTYDLQIGTVEMTGFGHGSFRAAAYYFDFENNTFANFAHSVATKNDDFAWIDTSKLVWFGSARETMPSDEPRCGFSGAKAICREKDSISWMAGSVTFAIVLLLGLGCLMLRIRMRETDSDESSQDWWCLQSLFLDQYQGIRPKKRSCDSQPTTRCLSQIYEPQIRSLKFLTSLSFTREMVFTEPSQKTVISYTKLESCGESCACSVKSIFKPVPLQNSASFG